MGRPGQALVRGAQPALGREQPPQGDGPALPPIGRGRGCEQPSGDEPEIDVGGERGVAGGEEVAGEAQIGAGRDSWNTEGAGSIMKLLALTPRVSRSLG